MAQVFKLNSTNGQTLDSISKEPLNPSRGVIKVDENGAQRTGIQAGEYIANNAVVMQGAGEPVSASASFDGGKITDLDTTSGQFGFSGRGHMPVENNSVSFAQPKLETSAPQLTQNLVS